MIELMVVIAIVGILASIAAPSFSELIRNQRLSTASSALQISLNTARSEAIKNGSNAKVTVAAAASAGNWVGGWTVFLDGTSNANNAVAPAADSGTGMAAIKRLEVVAAPSGSVSFGQYDPYVGVHLDYFTYNGQGRLIKADGTAQQVDRTVWFYSGSSNKYCVIVTASGRVRSTSVSSASTCPND